MLPRRFNDLLALIIVALIFAVWGYTITQVVAGKLTVEAVALIITATVQVLTAIVIFYFRKSPPPEPKP